MYELRIYAKAQREIKKISKLHQIALFEALKELQEDPFLGKPLVNELAGKFSYKVGPFRILYKVNKKELTISIITAGHRGVIYK